MKLKTIKQLVDEAMNEVTTVKADEINKITKDTNYI